MNYLQALFSIFNAPLFADVHHRHVLEADDAGGRLLGPGGRHGRGRWDLHPATRPSVITFGSDLAESMWGAGLAFVVDAIVTVAVTLFTQPKPVEELQGLVYGMANVDESAPSSTPGGSRRRCSGSSALGSAPDPDHRLLVGSDVRDLETTEHLTRRARRRTCSTCAASSAGCSCVYGVLLTILGLTDSRGGDREGGGRATSTCSRASGCSSSALIFLRLGVHAPAGRAARARSRATAVRAAAGSTGAGRRPASGAAAGAGDARAAAARAPRRRSRRRPCARRPRRRP